MSIKTNYKYYFLVWLAFIAMEQTTSAQIEWACYSGDSICNLSPIATKGVSSANNRMGSRIYHSMVSDKMGKLWVFGGFGYSSFGSGAKYLNDLWFYQISNNTWTWISGDTTRNRLGVYGTQGVSSSSNIPGSRDQHGMWSDLSGNIWVFGGSGYASTGGAGLLNDLWKYNPSTNQWTWVKGDNSLNGGSVYGIKGVSSPLNKPGARSSPSTWTDNSGNLWLFGGSVAYNQFLNDLWKYDINTNEWVWMSGDNIPNSSAVYGSLGVPSLNNKPSARWSTAFCKTSDGDLWLVGGYIFNGVNIFGAARDVWRYRIATNEWTWMGGPQLNYNAATPLADCKYTWSQNYYPAGVSYACAWAEADVLWVYSPGAYGAGDLWRFKISSNEWSWMFGDLWMTHQTLNYGQRGVYSANHSPGGRFLSKSATDETGKLWMFAGHSMNSSTIFYHTNDLWSFRYVPVVQPLPQITISANNNNVCPGIPVTFTATTVDPGNSPIYQWMVNGVNVGTNSPSYTSSTLANGNIISCVLISNSPCVSNNPVTSNAITITIQSNNLPTITIAANTSTICSGAVVNFTATAVNAGQSPSYQWKINGVNAGTNSSNFSSSTLNNGDVVTVEMTTSSSCSSTVTVVSNSITMNITSPLTPIISITASAVIICPGTAVNFTAISINGGSNPNYQWKVNGVNVGANNSTFTNSTLQDGDIVSCEMLSNLSCVSNPLAISNNISIIVITVLNPTVTVIASDTVICKGQRVDYVANVANSGTNPTFQWKLNGNNIGNNSPNYFLYPRNGDQVVCEVYPGVGNCSTTMGTSNTHTIIINPLPSLIILPRDTTIIPGAVVQLDVNSSAPLNSYTWQPGFLVNNPAIKSPTSSPLFSSTEFMFNGTTIDGCSVSGKTIVRVFRKFYMPNAFTPNKDGINDLFRIPPDMLLELHEFSIFDRWGNKIYTSRNLNDGWNGTYRGLPAISSVYVYLIKGVDLNGKVLKKGSFLLIR